MSFQCFWVSGNVAFHRLSAGWKKSESKKLVLLWLPNWIASDFPVFFFNKALGRRQISGSRPAWGRYSSELLEARLLLEMLTRSLTTQPCGALQEAGFTARSPALCGGLGAPAGPLSAGDCRAASGSRYFSPQHPPSFSSFVKFPF